MNYIAGENPDPTPAVALAATSKGFRMAANAGDVLCDGKGRFTLAIFRRWLKNLPPEIALVTLDIENLIAVARLYARLSNGNALSRYLVQSPIIKAIKAVHATGRKCALYDEFSGFWPKATRIIKAVDYVSLNAYYRHPWEFDPAQDWHVQLAKRKAAIQALGKPVLVWHMTLIDGVWSRIPASAIALAAKETADCEAQIAWLEDGYRARLGMSADAADARQRAQIDCIDAIAGAK